MRRIKKSRQSSLSSDTSSRVAVRLLARRSPVEIVSEAEGLTQTVTSERVGGLTSVHSRHSCRSWCPRDQEAAGSEDGKLGSAHPGEKPRWQVQELPHNSRPSSGTSLWQQFEREQQQQHAGLYLSIYRFAAPWLHPRAEASWTWRFDYKHSICCIINSKTN